MSTKSAGLLCLLFGCLFSLNVARGEGPERPTWANRSLKTTEGLLLWLDAAKLNEARAAKGLPPLGHDDPVEWWPDASGGGRDLSQSAPEARPRYRNENGLSTVRFDGEQTWLERALGREPRRELTFFVVAAPFSSPGDFRALAATNEKQKNDFVTGITIDLGPGIWQKFQLLNAEGAGFGGAQNLLQAPYEFAALRRLCVASTVGKGGVRLYVDGKPHGARDRQESKQALDEIRVGARYYDLGRPPSTRGFFDGEIAELLVYERALSDAERNEVDDYLREKYGTGRKVEPPLRAAGGKPLVAVADPPAVQVLVPGFSVRQLPVELSNINNVLYRADGKLVALAYNGKVYLLSDTNGDGLEDKIEVFFENKTGEIRAPIGMALTPPGYQHGQGLFLACKGKCVLLADTNGDDRADKEIVIASGWKELPHGVDALGVACDQRDGSVWVGLGCADYTNAYQVGSDGKAAYSLAGERGTILRIAPDFGSRKIVATGIRFPVGLRFNRAGDLFCTDQEGATWLANGNPFDELLHIVENRHYGFPPRHPLHLPNVIDEPSLFDYAPQHQSLCGFNFNEPAREGRHFGPPWWRSAALLAGYSRGKLYRTRLASTPVGYVAQTELLAALTMLPADVCLAPGGQIVVAAHSGGPDWGSGPEGAGKLYQISYTEQNLPQPALVWAAGPREVRIAFDRPLETEHLARIAGHTNIEFGRFVSAGDRFESLRPGYKAVVDQLRAPRHELPVHSVQITPDRQTLVLATGRHSAPANYAVTLPGLGRTAPAPGGEAPGGRTAEFGAGGQPLRQIPETDLRYDLCGVEAVWRGSDAAESAALWLPHLDLGAARELTNGSPPHREFWRVLHKAGTLTLTTRLNPANMLRPAVQPGSQIDYEWPAENVTLVLRGKQPFQVLAGERRGNVVLEESGQRHAVVSLEDEAKMPVLLEIKLATGTGEPDLRLSYFTNEDARERAFPLSRFLLPWAPRSDSESPPAGNLAAPELAGGNWARGKALFFGDEAACGKCHAIFGRGGRIGPDLSNLPQRDYHSVLRDISQPSFAINPDFLTQQLVLADGRVLSGVVQTVAGDLHVGTLEGKVEIVRPAEVESAKFSPISTMPEGVPAKLGAEKTRDLLTFLLAEPPRMPDYGSGKPPPPRSRAEVEAVLAGAPSELKTRLLRVALVAGRKDHGPGEHDYPAWQAVWRQLLARSDDVHVSTADDWPAPDDLESADVLVFYQQGKWNAQRAKDIDAFLARGGGLVYIHYAVDGGADAPGFAKRIGLAWKGGESRFRHGPLDLDFAPGREHPIARNLDKVHFHDESYWRLTGNSGAIRLLASGLEEGEKQPLFWTLEQGRGRVFVSILGHFSWTFDDPLFRVLLLRGIAWSASQPVDRFNDLVLPGARVK